MSLRQKDYIIAALAIGGLFVSPFKGWLGAVMLLAALALYDIWWRCPWTAPRKIRKRIRTKPDPGRTLWVFLTS